MRAGFEYGNTRLRARRARLLTGNDYSRLAGSETIERMIGALADTEYAADLEAATVRFTGLRILDEGIRGNLARNLRELRTFYPDETTELDLLLERFDAKNLRTIIRAQTHQLGPDSIAPLLVPAGRLHDAQLAELASQPGPRATIDLMVTWGIPSRATARRVLSRWPAYQATGEPAILEDAVNQAFAEHLVAADGGADECLALLRAEIDAQNLLTALRLRRARRDGEPEPTVDGVSSYLPGGSIASDILEAVARSEDAARVAEILSKCTAPSWQVAITAWAEHGDLVVLSEELAAAITHRAVALFHSGDPLGPAIPVAFVFSKENEARNLRLIGRGIVNRQTAAAIENMLVIP
jgi:V/A-type H+-transporting ATPase subunit C